MTYLILIIVLCNYISLVARLFNIDIFYMIAYSQLVFYFYNNVGNLRSAIISSPRSIYSMVYVIYQCSHDFINL